MTDTKKLIDPRLPRGFEDRLPAEIAAVDQMLAKIRAVYERYGFDPVETPLFEYTETLGKFLPDTDRPNEGVFSLMDDDEQWMSLRYDLTAPLARYFAENYDRLPKPFRSYRQGLVFRNEKPGPGRFRQFMQFDADTVGAAGPEADAEMCMMMADTMDALGLAGKYVVRVSSRNLLDGAMEAVGLGGAENAERRLVVLRAIDKLDRLGVDGVRLLLGAGRRDESGDFTDGAKLSSEQIESLERLYYIRDAGRRDFFLHLPTEELLEDDHVVGTISNAGANVLGNVRALDFILESFAPNEKLALGIAELKGISAFARSAGFGTKRLRIDTSVVRGLEYYTGPVFEIELTFEVKNEKGQPVVFGSVGGGGRYDGLVSRFRKDPTPATGFSIGVSRLAQALKLTGNLDTTEPVGPVVVLVLDRDAGAVAEYQQMVSELRRANIRAEMYLGASGMNAQMKYADRRNAPAAVIVGSNERKEGKVTIKDLAKGAEAAKDIKDNAAYKAAKVGQVTVERSDLLAELGKIESIRRMMEAPR